MQHTLGVLLAGNICDNTGGCMHYTSLCSEILSSACMQKNLKHAEDSPLKLLLWNST